MMRGAGYGPTLAIGGVEASDLARRYGTPLYAFDAEEIRARYRALEGAVTHRPLRLYYSVKAHASVGLLRLLRNLGAGLDACSPGDLAFAQAAGFAGEEVSYAGFGMRDDEIAGALRSGCWLVADSRPQIERIGALDPGRAVALRVNCGIDAGFHPRVRAGAVDSKFGIPAEELDATLAAARDSGLRVVGLHTHGGSDVLDAEPHIEALTTLARLGREHEALRADLEFIDVGGGWGSPFLDEDPHYPLSEFGEAATGIMAELTGELGHPIELRLEPGAYLVMDAGRLLTTVAEIKPKPAQAPGAATAFAAVDTSYNHVHSAVVYGTQHPVTVADRPDSAATEVYDIAGNLMQAGDVLARERRLPPLQAGDVLAFGMCGGYKACLAPTFNERPRPGEVLVDGSDVTVLRAPESETDLLRGHTDAWSYHYDGPVKLAEASISSDFGRFRMLAYEFPSGREHLALVSGDPATASDPPLVRVQSSCITGTTLHSQLCDCRQQLEMAMQLVDEAGGVVLYLDQEGRSHGLVEKVEHLRLIADGLDTVQAAESRGRAADCRDYGDAWWILQRLLGHTPVRLLTNNPSKAAALEGQGLAVTELTPLEPGPEPGNRDYLRVKREKLGHLLTGEQDAHG